jgi:hypothetical protein
MSGLILIPLSFAYTGSGNKFRLPRDRTQNLNPENEIGKVIHATISAIDQFEKKMHHGSQTQTFHKQISLVLGVLILHYGIQRGY